MRINSAIIDSYLLKRNLKDVQDYWIYHDIVPGEYLIEEPQQLELEKLIKLYELVKEQIINFKPMNQVLWNQLFEGMTIPELTTIYLIVGAPKPYDAMVREHENERVIILDLVRIADYSDDFEKLMVIVNDFLTHEVAHILIEQRYPYLDSVSIYETFIQMVFDEGIAHFISYTDDVSTFNWESAEMKQRCQTAYEQTNNYLKNPHHILKQTLIEANSGTFWEKFASIAGMFAVKDYYNKHQSLNSLLIEGPTALIKIIQQSE